MRANINDATFIKDDYLVSLPHCRQTMRYHYHRRSRVRPIENSANSAFRTSIETRCRLIKYQDRAISQQCPSDRNSLAFAARHRQSTLTDLLIKATIKTLHKAS